MFEGASGVTVSGGSFNDVAGDMTINDSSSHTTNQGSFNVTNETHNSGNNNFSRNDFSRNRTHNVHAGTVNNFDGAKNVNTGTNYGYINQNDHRGAMPSREPYAPQMYNYQPSRGQGSRPHNHQAYSTPPAGYYYPEQEHYHNDYQRHADGRPRGAPRYQGHAPYPPPPQGYYRYQVDPRDEEMLNGTMEGPYPGDDAFNDIYGRDEGEEFNPYGAYPPSAEGYMPASYPRRNPDVVASAPSTSYASSQSGPPRMNSNNPFLKATSKDKDRS